MPLTIKEYPSQEEIKECFDYDSLNGGLIWKIRSAQRIQIGDRVGTRLNSGHLRTRLSGAFYLVHRLVWIWHYGDIPVDDLGNILLIDHKDLDPSNNRIENLRTCTFAENSRNKGLTKANKSGFKGITYDRRDGKWYPRIKVNYKRISLGRGGYRDPEEAYDIYCKAVEKYHGSFGNTARGQ